MSSARSGKKKAGSSTVYAVPHASLPVRFAFQWTARHSYPESPLAQRHVAAGLPIRHAGDHTERVATTGGTRDARNAGASTASCPSSHNTAAPMGKYHSGRRGSS